MFVFTKIPYQNHLAVGSLLIQKNQETNEENGLLLYKSMT